MKFKIGDLVTIQKDFLSIEVFPKLRYQIGIIVNIDEPSADVVFPDGSIGSFLLLYLTKVKEDS
jgi:hypothetical protein